MSLSRTLGYRGREKGRGGRRRGERGHRGIGR